MLELVHFDREFRCFKKGDFVDFRPGINLLVGDQGCGKSSLLQSINALRRARPGDREKPTISVVTKGNIQLTFYDFEKDSPRVATHFSGDNKSFEFEVSALFMSHGQAVNTVLRSLEAAKQKLTMILDEPDMALSIRSVSKLVRTFKALDEAGHQVIAAVHNPLLIMAFSPVFSVEHRKWMPSKDFLDCHWNDEPEAQPS